MVNDAIYPLVSDLAELDSEIAILTAQRDQLRARISELVEQAGGKWSLAGVGRAEIRAPSIQRSYDRGMLDDLCRSLRESGQGDLADEIEGCKRESMRAGGLSVTLERKPKA